MKKQGNLWAGEQRFVRCSIRRLVTLVNQAYRRDPGFLSLGNTKYGLLRGALSLLRNCSWTRFDLRNARRSINYRPVKGVPSVWKWSLISIGISFFGGSAEQRKESFNPFLFCSSLRNQSVFLDQRDRFTLNFIGKKKENKRYVLNRN